MRSRWLLNLFLLLLVAGIALFLYLRPAKLDSGPVKYPVSTVTPNTVSSITISYPAKAPVVLEKREGNWYLEKPYHARASIRLVDKLLGLLYVKSTVKFPADDLAQFGLDHPVVKLKLGDEEFAFGTYNPINSDQYVIHRNAVYLVSNGFSEAASTQVVEMIDKNLLGPREQIAGFDFSHLEQWEGTGLKLNYDGKQWKVSVPSAKPNQEGLNQWFQDSWGSAAALSVEPYQPDHRINYPSFEVLLRDGKKVHFDKLQEAPQLLLGRPDEGMLYHVAPDVGFTLLNPPAGVKPQ